MLINPYSFVDYSEKVFSPYRSLEKANIVRYKRKIYVINKYNMSVFDSNNSNVQYNDVIIINFSESIKDDKKVFIKNLYVFSNYTEYDFYKSFKNSKLRLNYSLSSGYESCEKYTGKNIYQDLGIALGYDYEIMSPTHINIDDLYGEYINDFYNADRLSIIDPRYYTKDQYEIDTGKDVNEMIENTSYFVSDFIDNNTEIFYLDKNKINIFNNDKNEIKVQDDLSDSIEKLTFVNRIPLIIFQSNIESLISSYKFIYDTKMGVNFLDIKIPKDVMPSKYNDYLNNIKNKLIKNCKNISNKFGNIRLMYYYSDIEDKITILFDNENKRISYSLPKRDMIERVIVSLSPKELEDKIENYIRRKNYNVV